MKNKRLILFLVLLLVILSGCGPTYVYNDDETTYPLPVLNDPMLGYHDLTEEMHCQVQVLYDSLVTDLRAEITLTGFEETSLQTTLNDSGLSGDALAGDGVFSKNIVLNRIDTINGSIKIKYDLYENGISIKTLRDSVDVIANLAPEITEITMPDTLVRPVSGTKELLFSLTADDPNGAQDVTNAYFQVLSNSTGQWSTDFDMYDNGLGGDETAGDGVFSRGLEISSENSAVTNYFRFRVKDTASNFSDWALDSVVVR